MAIQANETVKKPPVNEGDIKENDTDGVRDFDLADLSEGWKYT